MATTIRIIGVPMDLGQSRRGVDMGPGALRYAGLDHRLRRLGYVIEDQGNMEIIADCTCVGSIDVVEINPILDHRNHTAEIAVELIASLLGQSIL